MSDVINRAKFPLGTHLQLILLSAVFGAGFKVIPLNSWKAVVLILLFTLIYTTWNLLNDKRLKSAPKYKMWWLLLLFILNMYVGEYMGMGIMACVLEGKLNVTYVILTVLVVLLNGFCLHRLQKAWRNRQ